MEVVCELMRELPEPCNSGDRMNELKPCPFCGEKVVWREYSLFAKRIAIEKGLPLVPMIRCESCGAMVSFDPIEDPEPNYKKEDAGTLWNTRHEYTCDNIGYDSFVCSKCGFDCYVNSKQYGLCIPDYCPNCGAKVME